VDLLLMSKADLDDRVLPSGRLREPVTAAGAADALLVMGNPDDAEEVAAAVGNRTVFRIQPHLGGPVAIGGDGGALEPAGNRAVAVAGIARPQRFFAAARAEGWDVVREFPYRDHHWFDARDVATITAAAVEAEAEVILTTEKDAMRLDLVRCGAGRTAARPARFRGPTFRCGWRLSPPTRLPRGSAHRLSPWRA
jgi:tetraacyldisaccharide 4'-kinase